MLIGPLGIAFEHRARAGAVDHRRDAALAEQPGIGVERRSRRANRLAEHRAGVLGQGIHQRLVARQGLECMGQQHALDVHRDAGLAGGGLADHLVQGGFHLGRVLLGDHAAVELEHHLAGHHIGVGAALDHAHVQVRVGDARHRAGDLLVKRVLVVQRGEDAVGGLQGVHCGVRHGRVAHLAVHRHLHLQAAVVAGDHLVAEAGGNQQVGLDDAAL